MPDSTDGVVLLLRDAWAGGGEVRGAASVSYRDHPGETERLAAIARNKRIVSLASCPPTPAHRAAAAEALLRLVAEEHASLSEVNWATALDRLARLVRDSPQQVPPPSTTTTPGELETTQVRGSNTFALRARSQAPPRR